MPNDEDWRHFRYPRLLDERIPKLFQDVDHILILDVTT
jgi:hypothetical protein